MYTTSHVLTHANTESYMFSSNASKANAAAFTRRTHTYILIHSAYFAKSSENEEVFYKHSKSKNQTGAHCFSENGDVITWVFCCSFFFLVAH